ncbi:beta strand repeat-containing protein, partial [Fructobacillus ficulneus]
DQQSLQNAHQPAADLKTQRQAAQDQLTSAYNKTLNSLAADPTLLISEEQTQAATLAQSYQAAKDSLSSDKTPNAQTIADALAAGLQTITYTPGTALADQKKAADSQVSDAAQAVITDISNDPTLTVSAVQSQTDAVTTAAKAITDKITDAQNAETIKNLIADVKAVLATNHTPGQAVDGQQSAANTAVSGAGTQTNQAIQNDPTLDQATKDAQKAKVNQIVKDALAKINADTQAAQIEADKNQATSDISQAHQAGQAVTGQQSTAIASLTTEAGKVSDAIDADGQLTDDQKTKQKADVATDLDAGKANINKATTADTINQALAAAISKVDSDHQTGDTIQQQKATAVQNLKTEADQIKAAIAADPTLDNAAIAAQQANVGTTLDKAISNIQADTVTDAQTISQLQTAGKLNIDNQHQVNTVSLAQQIINARATLLSNHDDVKAAINAEKTLTNATKATQQGNLDAAYNKADSNIQNATTAQQVEDYLAAGQTADNATFVVGATLTAQRTSALNALATAAQGTNILIAIDQTLTNAQKQAQRAQVTAAVQAGQAALADNQTPDAQAIADALTNARNSIYDLHKANSQTVDQQSTTYQGQLDQELTTIQGNIDADKTLTSSAKTSQKTAAQTAHDQGITALQKASSAQAVLDAYNAAVTNVDGSHQPGVDLATQKAAANAALALTAKTTKTDVTKDPTLLTADQVNQRAKIDGDLSQAATAINNAADADAIIAAQQAWNGTLTTDHVTGTPLATQQAQKIADLNQYAGSDTNPVGVWAAIDADPTLTDADKATQKAALAATLKSYTDKVTAQTFAQAVVDVTSKAQSDLLADHTVGLSLDDQKAAAKKDTGLTATQVQKNIAAEPTLNTAQITTEVANVTSTLTSVNQKIDSATTAQAILDAKNQGNIDINKQFVVGDPIADQIAAAKAAVATKSDDVQAGIEADPTLTKAERITQEDNIKAYLLTLDLPFSNATTAQQIIGVKETAIDKIQSLHVAGSTLELQRDNAKGALDTVANQVLQTITDDKSLTDEAKAAQRQDVANPLAAGHTAIDQAADAQAIFDQQASQTTAIQAQHKVAEDVQVQWQAAKEAFQTEHDTVYNAIVADQTLTNDQRQSQLKAVDQTLLAANAALANAITAQNILDVKTAQIKAIDGNHVPGLKISDQVTQAKQALSDLKDQLSSAVAGDNNLVNTSKAARQALLISDLAKYQGELDTAGNDSATTGQIILNILNYGKNALQNDRKSDDGVGASVDQTLDQQKASAKAQIQALTKTVQGKINIDNSLSQQMIDDQTASNSKIASQALTDLDGALNAQDLADKLQTALTALNKVYQTNPTSFSDQQNQAKAALKATYEEVKKAINTDPSLTSAVKASQVAQLDNALLSGTNQISGANKAVDLNTIIPVVTKAVTDVHQADNLEEQRQNLQNWYNSRVQALAATESAKPILANEQSALDQAITQAETALQTQITNAPDADTLVALGKSGLTTFTNLTLQVNQAQARNAVTTTANTEIAKVQKDTSLTKSGATGQDAQVSQINQTLTNVLANIASATTVAQASKAQSDGITALQKIYTPASQSFDQQNQAAQA